MYESAINFCILTFKFEPTPKSHFLKFTAKSLRRKESKINELYFSVFASWRLGGERTFSEGTQILCLVKFRILNKAILRNKNVFQLFAGNLFL